MDDLSGLYQEHRYLRVEWLHYFPDTPVWFYAELDPEGWETRKVEEFRDGTRQYAGPHGRSGDCWLGETPTPPLEEIAADPQFRAAWTTREEFETVWREACQAP